MKGAGFKDEDTVVIVTYTHEHKEEQGDGASIQRVSRLSLSPTKEIPRKMKAMYERLTIRRMTQDFSASSATCLEEGLPEGRRQVFLFDDIRRGGQKGRDGDKRTDMYYPF